jgi:hypothetical protein
LFVTGCAADPGVGQGLARVGEIGPDRIEGSVRVVGSHPFARTIVEPAQGEPLTISGPYDAEIGRLTGASVRVTGRLEDAGLPSPSLSATSYEVLSVDGDNVMVGFLERDEEGYFLKTGDTRIAVSVVSETLGERLGSLVWVVLDEHRGVARYGILREASR